jgi:hypothetical protein
MQCVMELVIKLLVSLKIANGVVTLPGMVYTALGVVLANAGLLSYHAEQPRSGPQSSKCHRRAYKTLGCNQLLDTQYIGALLRWVFGIRSQVSSKRGGRPPAPR